MNRKAYIDFNSIEIRIRGTDDYYPGGTNFWIAIHTPARFEQTEEYSIEVVWNKQRSGLDLTVTKYDQDNIELLTTGPPHIFWDRVGAEIKKGYNYAQVLQIDHFPAGYAIPEITPPPNLSEIKKALLKYIDQPRSRQDIQYMMRTALDELYAEKEVLLFNTIYCPKEVSNDQ